MYFRRPPPGSPPLWYTVGRTHRRDPFVFLMKYNELYEYESMRIHEKRMAPLPLGGRADAGLHRSNTAHHPHIVRHQAGIFPVAGGACCRSQEAPCAQGGAPIVLAIVFLRSKLGGNGATTAPCVASGRNLPAPGTPLAAGSSPRRRRVEWPWPEAKQHTHRTMCSIKGRVPRPERADSRLRGVFPCAQSGGTSPVVRHTDGSLQGTCRAKRALRTQFGRSNNTPAAPCAASGGKPPASGAPIPSYELFSPPEAARAADKYLLHSCRGLGQAAGTTSKICLADARVSQSRHRISSGENPSQSDQTARDSS